MKCGLKIRNINKEINVYKNEKLFFDKIIYMPIKKRGSEIMEDIKHDNVLNDEFENFTGEEYFNDIIVSIPKIQELIMINFFKEEEKILMLKNLLKYAQNISSIIEIEPETKIIVKASSKLNKFYDYLLRVELL